MAQRAVQRLLRPKGRLHLRERGGIVAGMTIFASEEALPARPDAESVRSVLVVGGGSSGWMAAAALATALSSKVQISLVESEAIGIVGVGEATIPPIQKFNRLLRLDERQFLIDTQGTFKLGIEFHNWGRIGDAYLHQFGGVGREMDVLVPLHHWWMAGRLAETAAGDAPYPQWQEMFVSFAAAKANRFAPPGNARQRLENRYSYAYHFDAHGYAAHLRKVAEGRGAVRVEGRITGVERNGESGHVSAVVLESGQRLEADLFIDCSGFRSLLLGGEIAEPFDDWSHWIPSDRALAVPTERDLSAPLTPYTKGIAHSVGWQWRIPLQHRTGNGHVFASAFSSEDEAHDRLLAALDTKPLGDPRLIKFTTGRRHRSWVGNVVAVGLSSGFLEPLESTSIHFVQASLERLLAHFPSRHMDTPLRDRFNRLTRAEWEDVRDFIIAHYHLTARDDSEFWRYTRNMAVPDSLRETLDIWAARGVLAVDGGHLFQLGSWSSMMIGQRFLPGGLHALANRAEPEYAAQQIREIAAEVRSAAQRLPFHADFVAENCSR